MTNGVYPYVLGGMQRHSFNLLKALLREGAEVTLFHPVPDETQDQPLEELFSPEERGRLTEKRIPFPEEDPWPGHYLRASYRFSDCIFRELKPDLEAFDFIYVKGFAGWKLIEAKKKGLKMPPVGVKFHGYEMFQLAPSFKARLQQFLLRGPVRYNTRHADIVFSYGGKITDIIRRLNVPAKRILEVPSGIEAAKIREQLPPSGEKRQFVFLGRAERRKGIRELTEALERLSLEHLESFEFHFIGPVPEEERIAHPAVTYHGEVRGADQVAGLLYGKDILVCPSHSEGMPNVILEGMANGLAVIATDVGATRIMVSEETGWLLEPPPNAEKILEALEEGLKMGEKELAEKREKALERVRERFTWEAIGKELMGELE